jgi:phosphodiesterase/alkaline phosphatase D-like protein
MPDEDVVVRWEVSRDEDMRRIVQQGTAVASPQWAHSVHVEVGGLPPDRWHWYRFHVGERTSAIARTRTLPAPGANVDHLRFAFVSCQAWAGGPYPAYARLAEEELDFVVHLGDYIYERADGSLEGFRDLHALYKTSPDLQAAHARFPFITTWDDHEVQNNYAADQPPGDLDGRPFLERRANAYRAYYEHLPLSARSIPDGPDALLYKRLSVGRLAELSVLDTRQYRSDQACNDQFLSEPCPEVDEPDRTMTGPEQERWLLEGLERSRARWNVIAQQTIMARFDYVVGDGEIFNLDQWDGYPAARDRILGFIADRRTRNPVVLSGDWHSNWVCDLKRDFTQPGAPTIATEFVGTSISSGIGWDASVRQGLPENPHVRFYNGDYRGYVICDVTQQRWQADMRIVTDIRDSSAPVYTLASFEVLDGVAGARRRPGASDGVTGRVTDATTGDPLPNVLVEAYDADGRLGDRGRTDADGAYLLFVQPGRWALEAFGVGFETGTATVEVVRGRETRADLALTPLTVAAGTGRIVPGPVSHGTREDIVIENDRVAMSVAVVSEDGQLPGVTAGKPLDLAMRGAEDVLDWLNLPYASAARPQGTEAWQQLTVRSDDVHVVEVTAERAVVRATGRSLDFPGVSVVTTYTVTAGRPWVEAETRLANGGASSVALWTGDALDHDGAGQRSGVPGHGTITAPYGSPAEYPPAEPWVGMAGTDRQTYGLIYDDGPAGLTAYGNGNWIMTLVPVELAAGAEHVLRRRVVAADNGGGSDPFAVLGSLYRSGV